MELKPLLKQALEAGASDLHLTAGAPPVFRVNGLLIPWAGPAPGPDDIRRMAGELLDQQQLAVLEAEGEAVFARRAPGRGPLRVSAFYQQGLISLAIRLFDTEVPTIGELGLPEIVARLALRPRGLVLVTGPAGSGKTTTLAAMIDLINTKRQCHILTLEAPVEYRHSPKRSIINQRTIGSDSRSFPAALQAALYQDPDVIMVGALQDGETVCSALAAAERGSLLLAAMPVRDTRQAIRRILDLPPPERQGQVRQQFAGALAGIISQRLIPRRDRKGQVAAVEFLTASPLVRSLILEGKIEQIYATMQSGVQSGMQTIDNHLRALYAEGIIGAAEARENAADRAAISRFLAGEDSAS